MSPDNLLSGEEEEARGLRWPPDPWCELCSPCKTMETDKNCRVLMTTFYLLGNVQQQEQQRQQLFSKLIWIIALILVDFVS